MTNLNNLLPLQTRVAHFDGGPSTHGFGTIIEYNGIKPSEYLESNFKDAVDIAGSAGLLGGLVSMSYDGGRYPYVVQWDHGLKEVYGSDSVTLLDAEVYGKAIRARFEHHAHEVGLKVSCAYATYDDEDTERAWQLTKLVVASFSPNRVLEFPIPH